MLPGLRIKKFTNDEERKGTGVCLFGHFPRICLLESQIWWDLPKMSFRLVLSRHELRKSEEKSKATWAPQVVMEMLCDHLVYARNQRKQK